MYGVEFDVTFSNQHGKTKTVEIEDAPCFGDLDFLGMTPLWNMCFGIDIQEWCPRKVVYYPRITSKLNVQIINEYINVVSKFIPALNCRTYRSIQKKGVTYTFDEDIREILTAFFLVRHLSEFPEYVESVVSLVRDMSVSAHTALVAGHFIRNPNVFGGKVELWPHEEGHNGAAVRHLHWNSANHFYNRKKQKVSYHQRLTYNPHDTEVTEYAFGKGNNEVRNYLLNHADKENTCPYNIAVRLIKHLDRGIEPYEKRISSRPATDYLRGTFLYAV